MGLGKKKSCLNENKDVKTSDSGACCGHLKIVGLVACLGQNEFPSIPKPCVKRAIIGGCFIGSYF
jgi:hypothetical protein